MEVYTALTVAKGISPGNEDRAFTFKMEQKHRRESDEKASQCPIWEGWPVSVGGTEKEVNVVWRSLSGLYTRIFSVLSPK